MSLRSVLERFDSSYHVSVAAEAFAAGFLAQANCDVSIQYGANQPEYDLIAHKKNMFMKVSVKGSQTGAWGLAQNYKKGRTYPEAIDEWAKKQSKTLVYCLVQFWGVGVGKLPRVYLVTIPEITKILKSSRNGLGNTVLIENYTYSKGVAKGYKDFIPEDWKFSFARVDEILKRVSVL